MAEVKHHWTSFRTARLLLTPISLDPSVVQDVFTIRSYESVYKWSVHPPWSSLAEAEEWIKHKMDFPRTYCYNIELLDKAEPSDDDTPKIFGTTGIVNSTEIGYQFHPSAWGKGYATEVVTGLVKHIYNNPALSHINELHAQVSPENPASKRVMEKCGFRKSEEKEVLDIKANYEPAKLSYEELENLKEAVKDMNIDLREGQFERPPAPQKKIKLETFVITRAEVEDSEYVVV